MFTVVCRFVLAGASFLVPAHLRRDWRLEWEAEVSARTRLLESSGALGWETQLDLVGRCLGAYRHAGWLFIRQAAAAAPARDAALALHVLARTPAASGTVVLSLGLGIGVLATIFALVHAALFRPLPYRDAGRLVAIYNQAPAAGFPRTALSDLEFLTFRRDSRTLGSLAAFRLSSVRLDGPVGGHPLSAAAVSAGFFSMVGPEPAIGRWLAPADFAEGAGRGVVLSHGLWRSWFGRDPGVVGRSIVLDGVKSRIVGVAPAGFGEPLAGADLWVPLHLGSGSLEPGARVLRVIGAMKAGTSPAETAADLNRLSRGLQVSHPQVFFGGFGASWEVAVAPPRRAGVSAQSGMLALLLAAGGLTLVTLLAGLIGHAGSRLRSPRSGWWRITPGKAAAALGGTLGLLLTIAGLETLRGLLPEWLPGVADLRLDGTLLAAVASMTVAGIGWLGVSRRILAGPRRSRSGQAALMSLAFAGAVILSASAILAANTSWRMRTASPGYEAAGVVAIVLNSTPASVLSRMAGRLAATSGIEAVTTASAIPNGIPAVAVTFDLEHREQRRGEPPTSAELRLVGSGYFGLLRLPIESGRSFDERSPGAAPAEVVVNRTMARRFWPGGRAIGRRLRVYLPRGPVTPWLTVVGIVGDVRRQELLGPSVPEFYLPAALDSARLGALLVRTSRAPDELRPLLGSLASPTTPVALSAFLARAAAPRRNAAVLLAALACGAIVSAGGAAGLAARASSRRAGPPAAVGVVIGTVFGAAVFWLASADIARVLLVAGQPAGPAVAAAAVVGMAVSVLAGWVGVGWRRV